MSAQTSIRDALYEAPGPRARRRTVIGTAVTALLLCVGIVLVVRRFGEAGQLDGRYWSFFLEGSTWSYLLEGFMGTVRVAVTSGVIALVLGLALMLGRVSSLRPLSMVCHAVINFFRGVPSLLLVYFFFVVIPQFGVKVSAFWMITTPVALAASGVLAEVFRAGVNAVPKGQVEAALSLGMSDARIMSKIILPQALRIVIPSLVSQLVVVVKDTTVAYVVSYPDLMQNARVLIVTNDALVSTYFVIAIIYILVNYAINQLSVYLARRSGNPVLSRTTENPV